MKKLLIALISVFLFSCTEEGIVDDFKDMNKLKDSLEKTFPDEKIRIKISNGQHIGISFVNSDLKKKSEKEKEEVANKVGEITNHFFKDDRIEEGSLCFAINKNYVIFKYSEAIDVYDLKLRKDTFINENDTVELQIDSLI